jgi:hypothetical protein
MGKYLSSLAHGDDLGAVIRQRLHRVGYAVLDGPLTPVALRALSEAYDREVLQSHADDLKEGSSTTRVRDFVNRGPEFDLLYVYPPLLAACCFVIGQPFRLSTMHARTVRPKTTSQSLHVDFPSDDQGWPMVGFIYMVDEFRRDNGATRFLPGSQGQQFVPTTLKAVPVCGPAGSLIIFNGSVWHGHGPNETNQPRRSIQGAYIRRNEASGEDLKSRMRQETLNRISPLAKSVLALPTA